MQPVHERSREQKKENFNRIWKEDFLAEAGTVSHLVFSRQLPDLA